MNQLLTAALLTLIAVSCLAQTAAKHQAKPAPQALRAKLLASTLTVDQILDRYVEALGGMAAAVRITSFTAQGTFEMPERSQRGNIKFEAKAPNKTTLTLDFPDVGRGVRRMRKSAFNGTLGWNGIISVDGTVVELLDKSEVSSAAELVILKRVSDFYYDFKLKQLYPQMTAKGMVKVEDRDAYVIEVMPINGTTERFYFDVQTGLKVRRDHTSMSGGSMVKQHIYYDDYRTVGGIKMPHALSIINADETNNLIYKFDTIRTNVLIPDKTFNPPWK